MAKFTFTNAFLEIDGVDLSNRVQSLTLSMSAEQQDATTMGSGSTRERLAGMKDWNLAVTFTQDLAAGSVDATLFDKLGTVCALVVRPVNAAAAATNPEYSGNGMLTDYQPLGGSVGDTAAAPVTFIAAGPLSRATS